MDIRGQTLLSNVGKESFGRGHPSPELADVHDPKGAQKTLSQKTIGLIPSFPAYLAVSSFSSKMEAYQAKRIPQRCADACGYEDREKPFDTINAQGGNGGVRFMMCARDGSSGLVLVEPDNPRTTPTEAMMHIASAILGVVYMLLFS